ncbi:MAG: ATP-binding cassette domain-containing protein, partial [Rhodothermales bacterium]|nr:ATP-binding cassette domain-containing protein [Rhodothermales bacterium]
MLRVAGVTKRYTSKLAVDRVSFDVTEGRIFGLLGPNGAGKTSTIRMIAFITMPDEGEITFQGKRVGAWSQRLMGYLPEERGLYKKMRVRDHLEYLAALKGLNHRDAHDSISYWLDRFDITSWANKRVEELSKGMQQKVQFIGTIAHRPQLLIFDEPFSGLDPINSELLQEVIFELKGDGRTILFASHRMEQVQQLCDDICLISDGRVLIDGPVRDVRRSFGRNVINLEFEGDSDFLADLEQRQAVRIINRTKNRAEVRLLDGTEPRDVLQAAMSNLRQVYRFELVEPSLNEIFITVVSRQNHET